jgi:GT2 family glycosyltransferase
MNTLNKKTIYIGMPSYNEPYLEFTIKQIFEKAEFPERIFVGVWAHNNDNQDISFLKKYQNIKYSELHYPTVLGTNFARANALSFYTNEDYYLQIDPHMIFKKNWDSILINQFNIIKEKYENPIISTFVPYWYMSNKEIKFSGGDECSPIYWYPEDKNLSVPRFGGGEVNWKNGQSYQEHYMTAGHFLFSESKLIKEIIPDTSIYFEGEEPCFAIRAWTRGYRIFTMKEVIIWHFDRYHKDSDPIYKFDRIKGPQEWVPQKIIDHEDYKYNQSLKRVKQILTGEITGYWGAPNKELLLEYQKYAGIDFNEFYK